MGAGIWGGDSLLGFFSLFLVVIRYMVVVQDDLRLFEMLLSGFGLG